MPSLGARQIQIRLSEWGLALPQGFSDHEQAFAAAGLDDTGHQQLVEQHALATIADLRAEGVHVRVFVVVRQDQAAGVHDAIHDLKVLELFPRELDQRLDDGVLVWIANHERHARRRGLALARSVVQEERIEVGKNRVQPFGRRRKTEIQHRRPWLLQRTASAANETPTSPGFPANIGRKWLATPERHCPKSSASKRALAWA